MSWDDTNYRSGDADASDGDGGRWDDTDDDNDDSPEVTVVVSIEELDVDARLASVRSRFGNDAADAMAAIRELLRRHTTENGQAAYLELLVALTEDIKG